MALFRYDATNNKLVPLTSEGSGGIQVGAVMAFAKGTTSPNWLLADGRDTTGTAEELRTHYPALYTYLGNSNILPDYRECTLVGVGQNDTDTIAAHDVYTLGEFKDDQLQNITGTLRFHAGLATTTGAFKRGATISGDEMSSTGGSANAEFDASLVARTGTTTHGKQKGVAFYIKATSAGIEVDKDLYATKGYVNDAVSYSTTEQLTGGKWIDGKPIYRRVLVVQTAFTLGTDWINIVPYCGNPTLNIDALIYDYNTVENGAYFKKSSAQSLIWGRQGSQITVPVGTAFIIEYTKTTD